MVLMKECTCVNQVVTESAYCVKGNSAFLPALGSLGELEEVVCFNRFNFLFSKEKKTITIILFIYFYFCFVCIILHF